MKNKEEPKSTYEGGMWQYPYLTFESVDAGAWKRFCDPDIFDHIMYKLENYLGAFVESFSQDKDQQKALNDCLRWLIFVHRCKIGTKYTDQRMEMIEIKKRCHDDISNSVIRDSVCNGLWFKFFTFFNDIYLNTTHGNNTGIK